MRLRWNARADTVSNMIMWFTGVVVVLILGLWFLKNNPLKSYKTLETLEDDLRNIKNRLNSACNSIDFYAEYNPLIEDSYIEFNRTYLCIFQSDSCQNNSCEKKLQKCDNIRCDTNKYAFLSLKNITFITINKTAEGEFNFATK